MKITSEIYLDEFKFWSGAVDNASKLTGEELTQLTNKLEEMNDGMTETEVNDMMWFDFEYVCELIGLEYDEDTDEVNR